MPASRRQSFGSTTSRRGRRQAHYVRSAILALLTYALGLIPFYFLTPVHQSIPSLLGAQPRPLATSTVRGAVASSSPGPATSPTTATEGVAKKVGAEVPPVVAPAGSTPAAAASPTAPTADSRYAFLLLGYGGGNHDGAYLSDSMMLVVVDPGHQTLTLLSIPRDSWVPLAFGPNTVVYNKINTAYAFAKDPTIYTDRLDKYNGPTGAGVFATDTVSHLLGVPIRYYLGLDFQGFREMIDAVGGVDVVVPDSFSANYPANDDPSVDASWMTVRFTAGPEHMTGARAIEFARAREVIDNSDEGSDFARSRRQRLIMEAFKDRLFQPGGLIHLPQLLSIASSHVDTNYAIPDVAQLSQLALGWKNVKIYQTALTINNYLEEGTGPDGTYLLVPSSPSHSWDQVTAFTQRLWTNPEVGVAMASTSVLVENDSGVPGAGTRLSDALLKLGYQVQDPISGPLRAESQLVDRTAKGKSPLVGQLDADLGKSFATLDSPPDPGAGDSIVLHLGSDDANLTLAIAVPELDAPSSSVGVVQFGSWDPNAGLPSNDATAASPTRRPRATETPRRSGTASPAQTPLPGTPSPDLSPTVSGTPVPGAGNQTPLASPTLLPVASGTAVPTVPNGTPIPTASATPAGERTPLPTGTAASTPAPTGSVTPPTPSKSPTAPGAKPTATPPAGTKPTATPGSGVKPTATPAKPPPASPSPVPATPARVATRAVTRVATRVPSPTSRLVRSPTPRRKN